MRSVFAAFIAFGFIGAFAPTLRAQDEVTDAEQLQIRRGLLQSVNAYRFKLPAADESPRLLPDALLRWSNPVSGIKDGVICGWVGKDGRPAVLAQVFVTRRGEVAHEFQSVSPGLLKRLLERSFFGNRLRPESASNQFPTAPIQARTKLLA
jgi:hypothetical protein